MREVIGWTHKFPAEWAGDRDNLYWHKNKNEPVTLVRVRVSDVFREAVCIDVLHGENFYYSLPRRDDENVWWKKCEIPEVPRKLQEET